MDKKTSKEFIEIFKLSRKYVASFILKHSSFFERPLTIEGLKEFCRSIQIILKKSPFELQVPGRLEQRNENNREVFNLFYSDKLDPLSKFNAIMHEIGHWLLLTSKNGLSQNNLRWRETFANDFSNLICIPFNNRFNVVKSMFAAENVKDIKEIIKKNAIKLNVSTLLRTLNFEIRNDKDYIPLLNSELLWISVKLTSKRGSSTEPNFRVLSSLYDFTKYYIPDQTRINNVIAGLDKSFDIDIGECVTLYSHIKIHQIINYSSMNEHNSYLLKKKSCSVEIFRLNRSTIDNLSTYLVLVHLNSDIDSLIS